MRWWVQAPGHPFCISTKKCGTDRLAMSISKRQPVICAPPASAILVLTLNGMLTLSRNIIVHTAWIVTCHLLAM